MKHKTLIKTLILTLIISSFGIPQAGYCIKKDALSAYNSAAELYIEGDKEAARQKLEESLRIDPTDPLTHIKLAQVLTDLGQWQKAIDQYHKAATLDPSDAFIHISIGNLYQENNRMDEAIHSYNKALVLSPDYDFAWLNLAIAQDFKGETKAAINSYERFLEHYPKHKDALKAYALSLIKGKEYKKAITTMNNLKNLDPENFREHYNLAKACLMIGDYNTAIDNLKLRLSNNPDDAFALADLGFALEKIDNPDQAVKYYKKALALKKDFPQVQRNLARIYTDSKKYEDAL